MSIMPRTFYSQPTLAVAKHLLGIKIVREWQGQCLTGLITETEAYLGETDSASHAYRGRTRRNALMFGKAGVVYVYLIYGRHFLLNVVTESENIPGAVLIRGIWPLVGFPGSVTRPGELANGPGKLTRIFHIDNSLNGWDVTRGEKLWFEAGKVYSEDMIRSGPRIGIAYAEPIDVTVSRRFWIDIKKENS